ncbi:hypothetical protein CANARDRAFT_28502 [[Candida] arabinofermentans NRRL YB-2248]|uniref:Amine oxidase n=1 Tax=[Candida] arabinofermentans NRRL YB-2248 TaxID=983967 RepID=A0A1E4T0J2_9ASCO|nr:hypothetical protein CANARDRAFT_28502 [[Candida] arabinofermentans NRRL YB-2248]
MATPHPFDPISGAEINIATKLIKDATKGTEKPHFIQMDRLDPPKKDMIKYLAAERANVTPPHISRIVYVYYYIGLIFHKALVNVTYGHIVTDKVLPKGVVGPLMADDVEVVEKLATTHPIVAAEIEKLKLPAFVKVVCDPWIYGKDDPNEDRFLVQCYMYLASAYHPESNHYSLPLKFSPVFNCLTKEFVRMDYLPAGIDGTVTATEAWTEFPFVEYHPDLNGESLRPLKPLIVQQPEGPSFTTEGNNIKWQSWEFRVIPLAREGFAIYDIYFKGRSILYRLSLSEMTVPYGDPRHPSHRKQAFDLGDCGFGVNANSLALGCDCLGIIKYLDFNKCDSTGAPTFSPNTVCLHEQDAGLLYKHVNYRTNVPVVARKREFVVQTIATVANYEYALNVIFNQAGEIKIHVLATGILSTWPIEKDITVPWGTNVGPLVMAANHQHMLSFRIDPAVDGHENSIAYDDVVTMESDPVHNPFNVGFVNERTYVEKAGYIEQSPFTNRSYKIVNENVINPISHQPVAYKIAMPAKQMLLADPKSYNAKRAHFATQQLWVTKYRDHELFAAGEFTNQSETDTGLAVWANGKDDVRNTDQVVWATMGFTHVPRTEDFPVMPVEAHDIAIVPSGFFDRNPALDVPQSNNSFNKSQYYKDPNSLVTASSDSCCKM